MQQQPFPLDAPVIPKVIPFLFPLAITLVIHISLLQPERLVDLRKLKCSGVVGIAEERAKAGGSLLASGQEIQLVG